MWNEFGWCSHSMLIRTAGYSMSTWSKTAPSPRRRQRAHHRIGLNTDHARFPSVSSPIHGSIYVFSPRAIHCAALASTVPCRATPDQSCAVPSASLTHSLRLHLHPFGYSSLMLSSPLRSHAPLFSTGDTSVHSYLHHELVRGSTAAVMSTQSLFLPDPFFHDAAPLVDRALTVDQRSMFYQSPTCDPQ